MPKNVNAVFTFIFKWWPEFIYIKRKKASQSWQWRAILSCFIMDFHNINLMLRSGISKLFKSTSRHFGVTTVLLLSMSTLPCGASLHRKPLLASPLNREERKLGRWWWFLLSPLAAPEPARACWVSCTITNYYYPALRQTEMQRNLGKDTQCFCCSSQELCLPGGETHRWNKFRARVHPAWDKDSTDCHAQRAVYSQSSSTALIGPDCHHKRTALLKIITCTTPRKRLLENRIM